MELVSAAVTAYAAGNLSFRFCACFGITIERPAMLADVGEVAPAALAAARW